MVKDINVGLGAGSGYSSFGIANGHLYFYATDGKYQGQSGLFKTNGTAEGTVFVKNLNGINYFATQGDKLYFSAYSEGGARLDGAMDN